MSKPTTYKTAINNVALGLCDSDFLDELSEEPTLFRNSPGDAIAPAFATSSLGLLKATARTSTIAKDIWMAITNDDFCPEEVRKQIPVFYPNCYQRNGTSTR